MKMGMTAGYISAPTDVMCFPGRLHNSQRSAAGFINYSIRPYCRSHDQLSWGGGGRNPVAWWPGVHCILQWRESVQLRMYRWMLQPENQPAAV